MITAIDLGIARRVRRLLPWAVIAIAAAIRVLDAANTPPARALDFAILPSVQYAHQEIWGHSPSQFAPQLAATNEITPGQRVDLLVLVTGYGVGADSKANVSYELVIHQPGSAPNRLADPIWVAENSQVTDPRAILFPKGIVRYRLDPGDPLGEYRFEVTVRDHQDSSSLTKSVTITVTSVEESFSPPADFDPVNFVPGYYQNPQPSLALAALAALGRTPLAERKADGLGAILGFYDQILADNPWLLPHFKKQLAMATDPKERRLFAAVLAFAQREDRRFGTDLPRDARRALEAARAEPLPVPSPEPLAGGQLDVLWGRFFASGKYAPIADLVAIVQAYEPHRGRLEAHKQQKTKAKTVPLEVRKDAVLGSALWSLGSNARQHRLVRAYVTEMAAANNLAPEMKPMLEAVLAWQPNAPGRSNP
jgi:hypothetical protein